MRRAALLLVTVLLAATSARATDLHYGAELKGIYNSNVFNSAYNVEDDGSFRGTPFVELRDPDGSFRWHLKYDPSYEQFVTLKGVSGWDQDVNGGLSWQVTPLLSLNVSNRFDQFHSLTRFNQAVGVPSGGTAPNERTKFLHNAASASLRFFVTPTQAVTLFGDHNFWKFSSNKGRDQQNMDAGLSYSKSLSKRLKLGTTFSWSRQYFAPTDLQPTVTTDYYHVSGDYDYSFSPTLQVHLSAGPTLVIPPATPSPPTALRRPVIPLLPSRNPNRLVDVTTCPTLAGGEPFLSSQCSTLGAPLTSPFLQLVGGPQQIVYFTGPVASSGGNTLTYFANASISKEWENWTFTLSYQRQANQSAGAGTNAIADVVYGAVHWHPTNRWDFYVHGSWVQRKQSGTFSQTVLALKPVDLSSCTVNPFTGLISGPFPQCGLTGYPNAAESASLRSLKTTSSASTVTWNASAYAGYRLTKRITLFSFAGWSRDTNSNSYIRTTTENTFTLWTGIRYEFEPIHL